MIAIFAISSLLVMALLPMTIEMKKTESTTAFIGALLLTLSQIAIMALCIIEIFK